MRPESFRIELNRLMPNGDLRLVRDPRRLLMDLWAVERKLPRKEYLDSLEQLRLSGNPRFVELELEGGAVQYDCAPEWVVMHVCKSDACKCSLPVWHGPDCYREPDMRDVAALRNWLYECRDAAHSLEKIHAEEQEKKDKIDKNTRFHIAKELKSSKTFRGLVYSFDGDGAGSTTERMKQ